MTALKNITAIAAALAATSAFGTPVGAISYSDTVTPNVIYGTAGGVNAGFTVSRVAGLGLELGLRARVRGDNIYLDQGNGNYGSFAATSGPNALFNFDFSINSNYNTAGSNLSGNGLTYLLGIDFNPAVGNAITFVYNLSTSCNDSQFGNNNTATNKGTVANCNTYASLMANNNVLQNSENLGFFGQPFDASAPGQYSFYLQAVRGVTVVGETDINVTVPEPAPLALMGLGLAGLVVTSRRRKARA